MLKNYRHKLHENILNCDDKIFVLKNLKIFSLDTLRIQWIRALSKKRAKFIRVIFVIINRLKKVIMIDTFYPINMQGYI